MSKRVLAAVAFLAGLGVMALALLTAGAMRPLPQSLSAAAGYRQGVMLLDRRGRTIAEEMEEWNRDGAVPLGKIPQFLRQAVLLAEDKRFFSHNGVDWLARINALAQNVIARKAVRGASSITEQTIKMLHPRPRNAWSRWVEGFEAMELERRASKEEILEFYLNQVPYASNRRGALQAARYYFGRDLGSLSRKEMIALAILPRAPSRLDLYKNPAALEGRIALLAGRMKEAGLISGEEEKWIAEAKLATLPPKESADSYHFAQHAKAELKKRDAASGVVRTSLDLDIQQGVTALLNQRMAELARLKAANAAVLVADHRSGEILAWVTYGGGKRSHPGGFIDAVNAPRQPGSSLKPFLYALALESGWTPATILKDEPLDTRVGAGLHSFRNYSRAFYGPLTLRDCLANSLNVPAVLALRHVGRERYLGLLRSLGVESLDKTADYYGDALALGAGEISLFEMTEAYTALANRGVLKPLTAFVEPVEGRGEQRIFARETASLVGDILSDPAARRLEFPSGALTFAAQTAVKTGTSTDYNDAWAFGYDGRSLVGIWMGNLSRSRSDGLTGATGPALLLRSVFSFLNRGQTPAPLYMSPRLARVDICVEGSSVRPASGDCLGREEWFLPGTEPKPAAAPAFSAPRALRLAHPVDGLQLAMDPRVPNQHQAAEFKVEGVEPGESVEWRLDGKLLAVTQGNNYLWPLSRGEHRLSAAILSQGGRMEISEKPVEFTVK